MEYLELLITVALLLIGLTSGTIIERKHFASIKEREKASIDKPCLNIGYHAIPDNIESSQLVTGSVVISSDYFKQFAAGILNFLGGRISVYESLIDRARREAILRMKQDAGNADMILNVRVDTSSVGTNPNSSNASSIEVVVSGTAIYLKK